MATVEAASASEVGHVRSRNEDAVLCDPDRQLLIVADGLGGHPAGHVASRVAVDALDEFLTPDRLHDPAERMATVKQALAHAHAALHEAIAEDPSRAGMGTTAVVAHVVPDEDLAVLGHVGDSRAYLGRDGRLRRLTEDHVWESAFGRTLTQALGSSENIDPEVAEVTLEPGDTLLLCTDGLTDMIDHPELRTMLSDHAPVDDVRDRLVDAALGHGGVDNITVIVARVDGS